MNITYVLKVLSAAGFQELCSILKQALTDLYGSCLDRIILTKSHSVAGGLFSEHFVNAGPFSKKDATWLNELFQPGQTGEYEADEELSEEDASKAIDIATEFSPVFRWKRTFVLQV